MRNAKPPGIPTQDPTPDPSPAGEITEHSMKTTLALLTIAASIVLPSCQGLSLMLNPDGTASGSYTPPPAKQITPSK